MKGYEEEIFALENEELMASSCDVSLYVKLMAYYLVQNKLNDAKFLWSRIPSNVKSDDQLIHLNVLLYALTTSNLILFFKNISTKDWSDGIKTIMEDLKKITREKVLKVIANAYTSILKKDLIELTNLSEDELEQVCLEQDWTLKSDGEQLIVYPKRPIFNSYNRAESEYQLSKLTAFVSFLEN